MKLNHLISSLALSAAMTAVFASAPFAQYGHPQGGPPQGGPPQGGPPDGGFRGGFRGGPMGGDDFRLLMRKDVSEDLQLTQDEKDKLRELADKFRPQRGPGGIGDPPPQDGGGGPPPDQGRGPGGRGDRGPGGGGPGAGGPGDARRAEIDRAIAGVLTADQDRRFKEIKIQLGGDRALMDPEVQKALKLSDDQKQDLQKAMRESRPQMPPPGDDGDRPDPEAMRAAMDASKAKLHAAVEKILSADQLAAFSAMAGKPFKAEQRGPGGPGGPGGPPPGGGF